MIDSYALARLIAERRSFKIGARGICIVCIPHIYPEKKGWSIVIPRAFVDMDVEDISILDDTDYYELTYRVDKSAYGEYHSLADLTQYDKLTVIA